MEKNLFVRTIGEFGIWQAIIVIAVYFGKCLCSWQIFAFFIIAANMPFDCVSSNVSNEGKLERYSSVCEDNCSIYKYDRSVMKETITSEWNLVCGRQWMIDFAQSIFMLGMLIGQPSFGYISDRFGRRLSNFAALAIVIVGTMGVTFGREYSTFSVFRFISGLGVGGTLTISFVILMEASGNKYREIICNLYHIPFNLGEMSLAGIGYALPRWRIFYFVLSVPNVLLVFIYLFICESPLWLISVGKSQEAEKAIRTIARRNKLQADNIEEVVKQLTSSKHKQTLKKANLIDLAKTSSSRKIIFHCSIIWLIVGLCYFGMQQYISELSRNIYKNILISSLVQMPAPIIIAICQQTYGRKKTTLCASIASGVCFLLLLLVDEIGWGRLVLACIGSLTTFGMFCTLYVYTSELFPTAMRNMAMGTTGTLCRLGGMVAPFIVSTTSSGNWIPPLAFGLLCFIAAISCMVLPETKGINLTDNLQDEQVPNERSNTQDDIKF